MQTVLIIIDEHNDDVLYFRKLNVPLTAVPDHIGFGGHLATTYEVKESCFWEDGYIMTDGPTLVLTMVTPKMAHFPADLLKNGWRVFFIEGISA